MLKVLGRSNSINVQKAMWTIGELGLDHERIDLGGPFGGLDTEEYGAMNPNRLIPTLVVDGRTLWESNTIVRYLAGTHGMGGLCPADPYDRARAEQWMDWQIISIHPHLTVLFLGLIRNAPEYQDQAVRNAANEQLGKTFAILDGQLSGANFVLGDRLTIADIPAGAATYRYFNMDLERPSLPNVERWYAALTGRPAFAEHVMIPLT